PFCADLPPRWLADIARGAHPLTVAGGGRLFYQGDPAVSMYLVHTGRFTLRAQGSRRRAVDVDTVDAPDVVGWSWMIPPYRWMFDAVATMDSPVTALDALRLRALCDANPELGYHVMKRVATVMTHRLAGAREQLMARERGNHGST